MRTKMPANLRRGLGPDEEADAERWWRALGPAARRALRDPRPPRGVLGRFEPDDANDSAESAEVDYYEYLVNHEIVLSDGRKFRICTAHPEARRAISMGVVRSSFRCPRQSTGCPMRALLAIGRGRDLRLRTGGGAT